MFNRKKKLDTAIANRVAELEDLVFGAEESGEGGKDHLDIRARVKNLETQFSQVTKGQIDGLDLRLKKLEDAQNG